MFPVSVSLGVLGAGNGKEQDELVATGVAVDLTPLTGPVAFELYGRAGGPPPGGRSEQDHRRNLWG